MKNDLAAMVITPAMLEAATRKAVETGLLPRRMVIDDIATNAELMLDILAASLAAASDERRDAVE